MAAADNPMLDYTLRLGDNALILGQRLGEWCGHAPQLEEDIALTNIALDLIGQARSWLTYAGEVEGAGRDEDKLAFLRDIGAFRNVLLVEQPNGDFGKTILRQFLFDAFHVELLEKLAGSSDAQVAAIAQKSVKEVRYHVRFSGEWVIRLGDGTQESRGRMLAALDDLWRFTGELFTPDAVDLATAEAGFGVDPATLRPAWDRRVTAVLDEATLPRPEDRWMASGGKAGAHSEHMGYILAEMQFLQRAYPGAQW
jgi:ring-1,2-phenylacetyl-CoA epoxidase subunit PaaC